jgi:hypothetical protein
MSNIPRKDIPGSADPAQQTLALSDERDSCEYYMRVHADSIAGHTPNVQRVGISYMYGGKWIPNKSHTIGSGNEFRVRPHIMIIGLDQKMMQTRNQDGSNGEPYVNHLPGRSELFLVIPIREWDDAQAPRIVGASER